MDSTPPIAGQQVPQTSATSMDNAQEGDKPPLDDLPTSVEEAAASKAPNQLFNTSLTASDAMATTSLVQHPEEHLALSGETLLTGSLTAPAHASVPVDVIQDDVHTIQPLQLARPSTTPRVEVPQDLAMLMDMVQPYTPPAHLPPPTALPVRLPIRLVGVPEPVPVKNEVEKGELSDHEGPGILRVPGTVAGAGLGEVKMELSPPEVKSRNASGDDTESDEESTESEESEDSAAFSSSDDIVRPTRGQGRTAADAVDVDDDDAPSGPSGPAAFASKNEIIVPDVHMPDFTEIDESEKIQNIGQVMNIVDSVVVVRGRGDAKLQVIDTGSLLVFEDRKVLGYVFETFGAVTQPLYSIRFPSASSIDKERVTISRPVFHVPERSNYVFTRHLLLMKGSDASNMHDEEVEDDDLEFSDDEKEAEYKRSKKLKRKYGDNYQPNRARQRDEPDRDVGLDYGDTMSLDVDPRAARGPPVRYDDDDFGMGDGESVASGPSSGPRRSPEADRDRDQRPRRGRGEYRRGGGSGGRGENWRPPAGGERGFGNGRGRGRGRGRGVPYNYDRPPQQHRPPPASYPPRDNHEAGPSSRALSPASEAIARVTGQYQIPAGPSQGPYQDTRYQQPMAAQESYDPRAPSMSPMTPMASGSPISPAQQYPPMGFPMGGYINPRFAFAPGFFPQMMNGGMGYGMQQQQGMGQGMQGGYWGGGQRPQQQPPQYRDQQGHQGGYPPQNGGSHHGGEGEGYQY